METNESSEREILKELVNRVGYSNIIWQLGNLAEDYGKREESDNKNKWKKAAENLKKLANNLFW